MQKKRFKSFSKMAKMIFRKFFLLICVFCFFEAESGGLKKKPKVTINPAKDLKPKKIESATGPFINDSYEKIQKYHPTKSAIVNNGKNAYQQCRATVMPSFINYSMGWGGTDGVSKGEATYEAFKSLSPPSIIINSAGNDHPKPLEQTQVKATQDYNAIFVGSLNPYGYKSSFSQEGPNVTIMAPSNYELTSATSTGQYLKFSGTSGAAPLVTGSLAGFEWLAGYHPTATEAKILLEKTALPTPYSKDNPLTKGAGMVNAYKLAMVGKKLKQSCGGNISCFKNSIRMNNTYTFPADPFLNDEVDRAFPGCSITCKEQDLNSSDCSDKERVFKKLRKRALLTPKNEELWKKIACIYSEAGFSEDAKGALNTYFALSPDTYKHDKYCKQDTDCALVPLCSKMVSLTPVTAENSSGGGLSIAFKQKFIPLNKTKADIYYIRCLQETGKLPLCNGKCRCGGKEKIEVPSVDGKTEFLNYQSQCVKSQCRVKSYESAPFFAKPPKPAPRRREGQQSYDFGSEKESAKSGAIQ